MNTIIRFLCILSAGLGSPVAEEIARVDRAVLEDGFVTLFNGKDLSGWRGDQDGYRAENDMIVAKDSCGNLYTETEYGDFILCFEFKLTPGANSGIGIRVPMNGHASSAGHEIQILDDTADKYRDIKAWQRHGSVYGIIPAKTGYLRPVGTWNEQEIRVEGAHIRVTLNGEVIVNADLAPYRDGLETPDGKKHPGLKRESGHISLAGHNSPLFFRNLRIKDLGGRSQPNGIKKMSVTKPLD